MPWNYKPRKKPDCRLKKTPTQKSLDKLTKMTKPFNYKSPRRR